jgi:hypothetical protein
MKTALICHVGDELNEEGLALWLGSFSDLAGVVVISEPKRRLWKRIRNEFKRSGVLGLLDVLAFRLYYKVRLAESDRN